MNAPGFKTIALALLLAALVPTTGTALPGDREQPILISADRALRDESRGVTVYSGNVTMQQGSMELEADRITFYHTTDKANEIVAEGLPAKMRQQPEPDDGLVHAEGETIRYFRDEQRVRLQTNASIEQEGALVTGDSIDYFIERQLVEAQADKTREGDQVFVVIPPEVQTTTPPEATPPAAEPNPVTPEETATAEVPVQDVASDAAASTPTEPGATTPDTAAPGAVAPDTASPAPVMTEDAADSGTADSQ